MQLAAKAWAKFFQKLFWLQIEERRRKVQEDHELEYEKALVQIKEDIREKEGDEMIESMKDEIRDWFINEKWAVSSKVQLWKEATLVGWNFGKEPYSQRTSGSAFASRPPAPGLNPGPLQFFQRKFWKQIWHWNPQKDISVQWTLINSSWHSDFYQ